MEWLNGNYVLTDEKERMDLDAICRLLADTNWAGSRPRERTERAFRHSVCFGLFHQGAQVGFARAVTDQATFTYLCDVVIAAEHRGLGLGKWMMRTLLEHPQLQTSTYALRTQDAHGLYEQFGFQPAAYLRKSSNPP
jgi:GNAT superfamily N-acetyltransferase